MFYNNKMLILLFFIICFSCRKNSKTNTVLKQIETVETTNLQVKNDTLFINEQIVLSVKLDSLRIEKLKNKHKTDFYTIMDDANYYKYEATKYLENKKIRVYYFSENVIAYLMDNKYQYLNTNEINSPLNLLFYKKNNPIREVVPIDVDLDYEEYFENK